MNFIQIIFRENFPRVFRDLYNVDDFEILLKCVFAVDMHSFLYLAFYFFRMYEPDSDEDAIALI